MYSLINDNYAKLDRTYLNIILCSKLYDKGDNDSTEFLNNILKRTLSLEESERIVIMEIDITVEEAELILKNYYVPTWALVLCNN